MKNQICLLILLFFSCYSFIQTNNEEIAGEENDYFGKAIKNWDLNSFQENLKKSGQLCNRNKAELIIELRNERDAFLCVGAESQTLLAYRKNNSKLSHYSKLLFEVVLCGVARGVIRGFCSKKTEKKIDLAICIVALLSAVYEVYEDEKECKELDEKEKQSKARLDIFNAMIRLAEEHPAQ